MIASSKLGDVNVEVTQAEPGDPLRCTLEIPLLQDAMINAVTAKLQVFEVVVWAGQSGSTTTTNKKINSLFEEKVELVEAQGQVDYYEALLEIPNDRPPTFEARNNYIVWQLSLRVDIARWPDWEHVVALLASPTALNTPP